METESLTATTHPHNHPRPCRHFATTSHSFCGLPLPFSCHSSFFQFRDPSSPAFAASTTPLPAAAPIRPSAGADAGHGRFCQLFDPSTSTTAPHATLCWPTNATPPTSLFAALFRRPTTQHALSHAVHATDGQSQPWYRDAPTLAYQLMVLAPSLSPFPPAEQ